MVTTRIIAIGVTLFFNINIIKLTKDIYTNSDIRNNLVKISENLYDHPEIVDRFNKRTLDSALSYVDVKYQHSLNDSTISAEDKAAMPQKLKAELSDSSRAYQKKSALALDSMLRQLSESNLSLGWKQPKKVFIDDKDEVTFWSVLFVLLGWSLAAGCISMGAPFLV